MAEQQEMNKSNGVIGTIFSPITKAWDALTRDGTLAAAGRQGADELWQALRAFPTSIHAEEPGTVLNPTVGEIADRNRNARLPSPSEIAKEAKQNRQEPGHSQEHDHGRGR